MKCKGCAYLRYFMNEFKDCGFHYCTRYKDRDGLVFGTVKCSEYVKRIKEQQLTIWDNL